VRVVGAERRFLHRERAAPRAIRPRQLVSSSNIAAKRDQGASVATATASS
jgi:hypothetical protein